MSLISSDRDDCKRGAQESSTLRHYCRNVRCRTKLPAPVEIPRNAFCSRHCHTQFYTARCIVCEEPTGSPRRPICHSADCRNRRRKTPNGYLWQGAPGAPKGAKRGEVPDTSTRASETQHSCGLKLASKPVDQPRWVQIAGPPLSPEALRLATLAAPPRSKRKRTATLAGPPTNLIGGFRWRTKLDPELRAGIIHAEIGD